MNKRLISFYLILIVSLFSAVKFFPTLFTNLNSDLGYIKVKTPSLFSEGKNREINIDFNKANIIIMMDDGWKTQYDIGYKYMSKKNIKASIAVIPNLVGHSKYMNLNNLQTLYDHDWDLLSHTYSHIDLKNKDYNTQYDQIKKAKDWLDRYGFEDNSNILIYPNGDYNETTINVMKKLNIVAGRTIKDDFNSKYPSDLYDTKVKNVISNLDPSVVYGWIDNAIQNDETLILLFHKLETVTDKSKTQYDVKNFYKIIDYIDKQRNDENVITFSEWIRVAIYEKKDNYLTHTGF